MPKRFAEALIHGRSGADFGRAGDGGHILRASAIKDFSMLSGDQQPEPFEFPQWLMQLANILT